MPELAPSSTTFLGLPGPGLCQVLWEHYVALLAQGVPSDRVLVLLDGSSKARWQSWLRGGPRELGLSPAPAAMGGQLDHTPASFVQQELRLWWGLAVEGLARLGVPAPAVHEPVFAAIDLSQYMLTQSIEHLRRAEAGFLSDAFSAAHYQHVQILDALARALEHGCSLQPSAEWPVGPGPLAVLDRHGRLPAEPCVQLARAIGTRLISAGHDALLIEDLMRAIALYVDGMLAAGVLDHALQLEVYVSALWPDPRYQAALAARVSHVLVENLDELSPRWQTLIEAWLQGTIRGCLTLQHDVETVDGFRGGLREYVGADPRGAWTLATELTRVVPAAAIATPPLTPFAPLGRALLAELVRPDGPVGLPARLSLPAGAVEMQLDAYSPAEMLQAAADRVITLLTTGQALPRHIAIVSPTLAPLLIWSLRQKLEPYAPLYVFAGTNRLRDYRPVRTLITLAKLAHSAWELRPTRYELLELLELTTGLNPLKLGRLVPDLFTDGRLVEPAMVYTLAPDLSADALQRYTRLFNWLDGPTYARELPIFFRDAFARIYAMARTPVLRGASGEESYMREISQIGQLVELAERFSTVDERVHPQDPGRWALRFLAFLDDSPIAERPFFQREPHENAVMLSTPSQLAERGFAGVDEELRCLFVLDIGSPTWLKPDRRELTNARVLSRHWAGGAYDMERERQDQAEKLGRVLMACCLKTRERLFVLGCLTDEEGRENDGELPYLITSMIGPQAPLPETRV